MVTFQIRSNPHGQYYLPKEVRQELGRQLNLICDTKTAVIYSSQTSLDLVLKSLKILCSHIENRLELERQECDETAEKFRVDSNFFTKGAN